MCLFKMFTSGTEVASSYANLSEQEKESTSEKSSSPTGVEFQGSRLTRRVVSLDKELYSTLSLFTRVYKWVQATY